MLGTGSLPERTLLKDSASGVDEAPSFASEASSTKAGALFFFFLGSMKCGKRGLSPTKQESVGYWSSHKQSASLMLTKMLHAVFLGNFHNLRPGVGVKKTGGI